jgi:hypothetical protein
MNVNCKLSLTDHQRNQMHNRLTGTLTKKMVSRADVNTWVTEQLDRFMKVGSPITEKVEDVRLTDEEFDNLEQGEIEYVITQNKLLLNRINVLQHALDTRK